MLFARRGFKMTMEQVQQTIPTPLRTGETGVYIEAGRSLAAVQAILYEAYQYGVLGFDLEWAPDGRITWIGLGYPARAISLWRPTLPKETMDLIRQAVADPNFPKLAHNCQADIQRWEAEEGPVGGRWEDSMLAHHAAYPGLAHDLQNVVSQFCVVPPWKVWHKQAQEAAELREKEFRKAEKAVAKETIKAEKAAAREQSRANKMVDKFKSKGQKAADGHKARYGERHDVSEVMVALQALLACTDEAEANLRCDQLINQVIPREKERIKSDAKRLKAESHLAHNDPAALANADTPQERTARKRRQKAAAAVEAALDAVPPAPPLAAGFDPRQLTLVEAPVPAPPAPAPEPEQTFNFPRVATTYNFPRSAKVTGSVTNALANPKKTP